MKKTSKKEIAIGFMNAAEVNSYLNAGWTILNSGYHRTGSAKNFWFVFVRKAKA